MLLKVSACKAWLDPKFAPENGCLSAAERAQTGVAIRGQIVLSNWFFTLKYIRPLHLRFSAAEALAPKRKIDFLK